MDNIQTVLFVENLYRSINGIERYLPDDQTE
jgi:hypothetical protein